MVAPRLEPTSADQQFWMDNEHFERCAAISDRCLVFELKPEENVMQHELVSEPFKQRDGWVDVPVDKPGLGIEVDESVVTRYRL